MRFYIYIVVAATAASACRTTGTPETHVDMTSPKSGEALLARMHDAYAGKWFNTLTFAQKTTIRRPNGTDTVQSWHESMMGNRLRIDVGDIAAGNGSLSTPDSTYIVRAGKLVRAVGQGNPFIAFVGAMYLQPIDQTLKDIAGLKFNLSKVRGGSWQGRDAWVVGSNGSTDLDSPQFWVDKERLVVVRMLLPIFPNGKAKAADIQLNNYVPLGGGWLATTIRMLDADTPRQIEEYSDWKFGMKLSPDLFKAESWSTAPHWMR